MGKFLMASILFVSVAAAADLTGNWSGEIQSDGEAHPVYLVIKQDGNTLTGSGGPDASDQHPIKDGTAEGGKIIINVPAGKGVFHFELTTDGEGLKGTFELKSEAGDHTGTVTLKRVQ